MTAEMLYVIDLAKSYEHIAVVKVALDKLLEQQNDAALSELNDILIRLSDYATLPEVVKGNLKRLNG